MSYRDNDKDVHGGKNGSLPQNGLYRPSKRLVRYLTSDIKKIPFRTSHTEPLTSVFMQEPYKLKADEEWPEEVAHLFANKREGEEDAKGITLRSHLKLDHRSYLFEIHGYTWC